MSCYCLDANIFIDPWGRDYPPSVFPTLWKKISEHKEKFIVIKNIFNEIDPPSLLMTAKRAKEKHPLRAWLINNQINSVQVPRGVEEASLLLEKKYQIRPGSGNGASQNDLILITYAKENQKTIVTLESRQPNPPEKKHKYKIPLICSQEEVECINYVEFLKRLGISI